jgi:hypothetical protein
MSANGRPRRRVRAPIPFRALVLGLVLATGIVILVVAVFGADLPVRPRAVVSSSGPRPAISRARHASGSPGQGGGSIRTPAPINTAFAGLTTFRGNASRSYYGRGPVPTSPSILWRYPTSGGLCSRSRDLGTTSLWCGTGWTGQPNVIPGKHGSVEVRIGAFDSNYHFLDGRSGQPLRPDLVTGDLAKGSATTDPAGYPLYYAGSRDNLLRVVAMDRNKPTVLWSVNSHGTVPHPVWNDDWDGAPLIIGDYLIEGGENSWLYVIRLHRGYDAEGRVTVDPKIVLTVPGYDDRLMADLPDDDVSIENSVAFRDGVVYFANSGGLVQGWDISDVLAGGTQATRVFRFWTGDDTDASVVIDEQGFLYVGSELQRFDDRSRREGQLMKLDPTKPDDPLVWSIPIAEELQGLGGTWATPAIYGDMLYEATNAGDLLGVDRMSGRVLWRIHLTGPMWSSPVPIDGVLVQGDCNGVVHAYDISHPSTRPTQLWSLRVGGCIESTPAVWDGMIYVGTRAGGFYGIGDRHAHA